MASELRNILPKAMTGARVIAVLAMMALLAPGAGVAQNQAAGQAQIDIAVDTATRSLQPEGSARVLVRVGNTGTGQPVGSRLLIPVADGLSGQTWACTAHAGASCAAASGSGSVDQALGGLVAGGWIEYALTSVVSTTPPDFITVAASTTAVAAARCADGQTQPCRSLLSLPTGASLFLDIDSDAVALQPGGQVSYTIVSRSHDVHSSTAGSVLRSPVPNGLTNSHWTCSSSVGACAAPSGSGPIEQVLGDFSAGEISFRVNASVTSTPPATVVQAAAITPPYGGSCARTLSNVASFSPAPCVARKPLATSAKILVSRTEDYRPDAGTVSNRYVLENMGANAAGSVISAKLSEAVLDFTWQCTAEGASCPQASGAGAFDLVVASWPASARFTFDVVARFDPANAPDASSSLTVSPPAAATCAPSGTPPPCHASAAKPASAVFELQQHATRVGALPGQVLEYSISVANTTTDVAAQDVVLSVPLARGIEAISSWSCVSANSAIACPVAAGSGPINQLFAQFAPGSRFTYSIQARVAQSAPATIDARATLAAPASASMGCASASGSPVPCVSATQFSTVPILALEQSATATSVSAGGLVNYVLDVFNLGADAGIVNVKNVLPDVLAGASWVCSGLGMGCPSASGSGNISESIAQMPEGSSVRYSVSAQVNGALPDSVSNTLIAAPAAGGRCHSDTTGSLSAVPCSDRFETSFSPVLKLSQLSNERQLVRGGVVNYSVSLTNTGGAAADTRIGMAMPEGISHLAWTCSGFAGAVCARPSGTGEIDEAIAGLPANGRVTYSIRAQLTQDAPAAITNQVAITPAAGTLCAGGECSSTLSLPVAEVPTAHLQVSVQSPTPVVQSGGTAVWMVDVRNLGSEIAGEFGVNTALQDSGFVARSWTCDGAECPAPSGTGTLAQTVRSLAVYQGDGSERSASSGRVVFTMLGTVTRQPDESATFSAAITPATGDTCGPVNCQDRVDMPVQVLGVSEATIDLNSNDFEVFPNSQVNYNFTISNTGGATLNNLTAFSVEPPEFTSISWTCAPFGGATCPTSGSGTINELLSAIPISGGVTFFITANTASTLPTTIDYQVGANVEAGVLCQPASCTNTLSLPLRDELTITLDASASQVVPNGMIDYTFRLENTGGGGIFGIDAVSVEPIDFASSSWTCVATGGANCMPNGFGPIFEPLSFMPQGSSVTFTITAIAASQLQPTVDFEVRAVLGGQGGAPTGALPCNPVSCSVVLSLPSGVGTPPTVSLSKTANQTSLEPGGAVRYTVVVANTGSTDAGNLQLSDMIPAGLASFTWSCSATGDTLCSNPTGTGDIDQYIEYIAAGSTLTYVVDAVVSGNASGTVRNLASLIPFDPIICVPASCSVASTLPVGQPATLDVSKTAVPASGIPVGANQPISWTLRASNSGGATRNPVTLTDRIPVNVGNASVVAGSGVTCNTLNPQPGANLVCTIAAGFTGQRTVDITATVSNGATGSVDNTVQASGQDGPVCSSCTVSNPIVADVDTGIANARAYNAGGLAGTLFDIVNMSATTAQAASVVVTPASSVRFLAPNASGCTATPGGGDSIVVSCPSPPSTQGISCSGNGCAIATLPQNAAATLFVALNAGTSATVQLTVPGDSDASNNTLVLPLGGTP